MFDIFDFKQDSGPECRPERLPEQQVVSNLRKLPRQKLFLRQRPGPHLFVVFLDFESSLQIILYGVGSLIGVWLLCAIVGAIDSIPVLPTLFEIVGLGYSIWFTTRYLLSKKSREELTAKIKKIKGEVLGTGTGNQSTYGNQSPYGNEFNIAQ